MRLRTLSFVRRRKLRATVGVQHGTKLDWYGKHEGRSLVLAAVMKAYQRREKY